MFGGYKIREGILIIVILLLFARPTQDQKVGWAPLVDHSGREITLPSHVEKIYATTESGLFLVYSLQPEAIIGWNRGLNPYLEFAVEPRFHCLPTLGSWDHEFKTIRTDLVLEQQPDLIVHYAPVDSFNMLLAAEIQETLGIPTVLIDNSLPALPAALRFMGEILGKEARGSALAAFVENHLARAQDFLTVTEGFGEIPIHIISPYPFGYFDSLLELAGMVEVEPRGEGALPDFVLVMPHSVQDPYSELEKAGYKRIYQIPSFPTEWLDPTSIFGLLGLEWLLSIAYPNFYAADLGETYKLFMEVFFEVKVTSAILEWTLRRSGISY
ncbi:MAG TPA: hypothetical protein GX528_01320 [Firmicutes bacterium]|nr:hypothetical protein [Bacillota bacterium]